MPESPPALPRPTNGFNAEWVRQLLDEQGLTEVIGESRRATLIADVMRAVEQAPQAHVDLVRSGRLAQALERFAMDVESEAERQRLFDEAFLCRRAIDPGSAGPMERLLHITCLAADGLEADRRPDVIMVLRSAPSEWLSIPPDLTWPEELALRIARAFVLVAKRDSGWDDLRDAAQEIGMLRSLQAEKEDGWAEGAGMVDVARVVVLYNLARMAEIAAEYSVSGEPADAALRLERHHTNIEEILAQTPDPDLTHLCDLLFVGAKAILRSSVWTTTRTLGANVRRFVDVLASSERENPVLELWPSQRSALRSSLLDPAKRALVVQMPTSSGKTLIAEFGIVQALALNPGSKVAYVVPTRALVNQVARRLRLDLSELDYAVEAAVPVFELDPVEDEFLRGHKVDVLVTTPEKLDLLIRQEHPSVANLSLVVADEAHNLAADDRGARLELLLSMIKRERAASRFLLLSPFTPNVEDLAEWLGDDPEASVTVNWKPTDVITAAAVLERGASNRLRLRLHTIPGARDVELGVPDDVCLDLGAATGTKRTKGQLSTRLAASLTARGAVLFLCIGRATSERRAREIAATRKARKLSELGEAVVAFAEAELGAAHPLASQIQRGVCFHHAGISHDLRFLLERLIEMNDIDVICGTSTLAQGVNFPIATVVVETLKRKSDGPQPWVQLPFPEFWNIAGRAGRALKDPVGLVAFSAPKPGEDDEFRSYLQEDSLALASALLEAVQTLGDAETEFNLSFVAQNRVLSVFTQYIAHALRVGGAEAARADVEDLLRSSLVFSQVRSKDEELSKRLVQFARRYIDQHAHQKSGWLRLADGTGFSLESVNFLYAQQKGEHPELRDLGFWGEQSLFGEEDAQLINLIDVIGRVPELSLGEEERSPFNPELVAQMVRDWVDGYNVTEIANRRLQPYEKDEEKRVQRAGRYLHTKLVSQVPWGMGAVQRVALAEAEKEQLAAVGHIPSLVFYGVRSKAAAALRMAGVPRVAAEGLGQQLGTGASLPDLASARQWVAGCTTKSWNAAIPGDISLTGKQARLIWTELAGGA